MSLEFDIPTGARSAVLSRDFTLGETEEEARFRLEAEHRLLSDWTELLELRVDNPQYANALDSWLESEKEKLIAADVKIDDEMLAEAEILDEIIAEVNEDHEDPALIRLAEVMKDIREAQHDLSEIEVYHQLAA